MLTLKSITSFLYLVILSKDDCTGSSEIPIHDALTVLRSVVRKEKMVRDFFHEHYAGKTCGKPSSCAELMFSGVKASGIYTIYPRPWMNVKEIEVYCDMDTDGGGWTVFQRRDDFGQPINFTRGWTDYANGFGNKKEEFWLGNDNLNIISTQDHVLLRIDLKDFDGNYRYAIYETFEITGKEHGYKMRVENYKGDAGNSFGDTNEATFVTFDHEDVNECAKKFRGGWWYKKCHNSNLNGEYLRGKHETFATGVNWNHWLGYHYSLKWTEMKIRPIQFTNCDDEAIFPQ